MLSLLVTALRHTKDQKNTAEVRVSIHIYGPDPGDKDLFAEMKSAQTVEHRALQRP